MTYQIWRCEKCVDPGTFTLQWLCRLRQHAKNIACYMLIGSWRRHISITELSSIRMKSSRDFNVLCCSFVFSPKNRRINHERKQRSQKRPLEKTNYIVPLKPEHLPVRIIGSWVLHSMVYNIGNVVRNVDDVGDTLFYAAAGVYFAFRRRSG